MYVSHMLPCACSKIIPTYKILMQKKKTQTLLKVLLDFFTFQSIVLDHVNAKRHGVNGSGRELWARLPLARALA